MNTQRPYLYTFARHGVQWSLQLWHHAHRWYSHQPPYVIWAGWLCVGILLLWSAAERSYGPGDLAQRQGVAAATAETTTPAAAGLHASVESWLGTPYLAGGHSRSGTDCSGFVLQIYAEALGVHLPRSATAMYTQSHALPPADRRPGDLVFFNTNGRSISHVGIYMGEGTFVHAANTGVQYDPLDAPYWAEAYVGTRRPNQR